MMGIKRKAMTTKIEIEIDGQKLEAPQGAMIIEVADANNFHIPRFCYHKKLSVAANCRMCLVEVEKMPKTVPACATPVTQGMKVFTQSQKTRDSQRAVMEFLLINHPLDCPICDQGGECELQDNSMGYGAGTSPYAETKRVVNDENIGPLIQTNLTRCIQCTRCVRFGQEIAGIRELGMVGRGEDSEISTFLHHALTSEVSGNVIDLCPVGALTSKPFLYKARAWELDQVSSIAPHDSYGSNVFLHKRGDDIMRVVPEENEAINETWLSDRDRFSYCGIKSSDRLLTPMVKRNGQWHATDWETALNTVVTGVLAAQATNGNQTLLTLSSPSASLEEYYLLTQLTQRLGASDITYHLRDSDLADQEILPKPHFGISIADVECQKAILLVGADIMQELPLLALRMRKASLAGARIDAINPVDFNVNFTLTNKIIYAGDAAVYELAAIAKVLLTKNTEHSLQGLMEHALIRSATVSPAHELVAQNLEEKGFIYLGALSLHSAQASTIRLLTAAIAALSGSQWGMYSDGSNSVGLASLQPPKTKSLNDMIAGNKHKAILLHNIEPDLDCANPSGLNQLLQQAQMVVACTPFKSNNLLQMADVLLPIATFGETSGSFVNLESKLQSFKGYVPPCGEARPAWRVFRVLANLFKFDDFTYTSTQDLLDEIKQNINFAPSQEISVEDLLKSFNQIVAIQGPSLANNELYCITQWPIYKIDPLVRRAEPLQDCGAATALGVYLNSNSLQQLGREAGARVLIEQNNRRISLPLIVNNRVADKTAVIPMGFTETSALGNSFGTIRILHESN
jgi:NADH-quinone oxidoreductase subunit G